MKRLLMTVFSVVLAGSTICVAQNPSRPSVARLMYTADSLRMEYRFKESSELYANALEAETDSLRRAEIEAAKVLSDNGELMLGFVSEPTVVARHRFSVNDFFLFYPLEERAWKPVPNKFDPGNGKSPVRAIYFPENSTQVYFSKAEDDCRNLYRSSLKDTIWSVPELINETVTSTGNEIYPMLSPDGKSLYFASNGLYGVGGYDLYVCNWDEGAGDWGAPVNMGFPYSSPADDYLYINTEDGKYTIFASNRCCGKDSVDVFVLEFDNMPVRREVSDYETIRRIAALNPVEDPERLDNGSNADNIPDNEDTRRYVRQMSLVRALKDSINLYEKSLDSKRAQYAACEDDAERERLTSEILLRESLVPKFQDELLEASKELQKIEMDFLFKGVVIDPEKLMAKAEREVVGTSSAYTFTKMTPGRMPLIEMEVPKVEFDYTFKILPLGQFALDNKLPDGIVYQIQMFTVSAPVGEKQLNGLSPVFEIRTDAGKYIYRAGVFSQYSDALANLNKVRRKGFRSAFITAFQDGKRIDLNSAREKEKTQVKAMWQVVINPGAENLPKETVAVIKDFCDKDVVKIQSSGITMFVVAPFSVLSEAEELEALVKESGTPNTSVSEIPKQ